MENNNSILTIDKRELYKKLIYIFWCDIAETNYQSCESHKKFVEWKKYTNIHSGDCTKDCHSCERCRLNELEIQAENALKVISRLATIGYCGKECNEDCSYDPNKIDKLSS